MDGKWVVTICTNHSFFHRETYEIDWKCDPVHCRPSDDDIRKTITKNFKKYRDMYLPDYKGVRFTRIMGIA